MEICFWNLGSKDKIELSVSTFLCRYLLLSSSHVICKYLTKKIIKKHIFKGNTKQKEQILGGSVKDVCAVLSAVSMFLERTPTLLKLPGRTERS